MKKLLLVSIMILGISSYGQNLKKYYRAGKLTTAQINEIDTTRTDVVYEAYNDDLGIRVINRRDDNGWVPLITAGAGTGDFLADGTVPMTGNLNMNNNIINDIFRTNYVSDLGEVFNFQFIGESMYFNPMGGSAITYNFSTDTWNVPGISAGTDNQTAAKVPFTPTAEILSTDVQNAIEELRGDMIIKGWNYVPNTVFYIGDNFQTSLFVNTDDKNITLRTLSANIDLDDVDGVEIRSQGGINLNNFTNDSFNMDSGITMSSGTKIELTAKGKHQLLMDDIGVRSTTQWEAFDNVVEPDSTLLVTVGYLNSKLGSGGTSGTDDKTASEVAITDTVNNFTATNVEDALAELANVGGITDGDKGDIIVSSLGTTWNIDVDAVNSSKIQDESITGTDILDGTIQNNDIAANGILADRLNTTNAPVDNYILTSDITSSGFTWVDPASLSGTDDRTALEVPFTSTATILSTDVQNAIEEVNDNAIIKGVNVINQDVVISNSSQDFMFAISPANPSMYLGGTSANMLLSDVSAIISSKERINLQNTSFSENRKDWLMLENGASLISNDNVELTARDNGSYSPTLTLDDIGVRSTTQWEAFDNVVEPDSTLLVTVGYLNSKLGSGGTSGTDDKTASEVAITDTANNFTATNVEDALAELATDTSTWTNIPLQNGIVQFTGFASPQYKISNGRVWFKGTVRNTSGSTLTGPVTVAIFPVGARPQERMLMSTISNLALQRFDIDSDGTLKLYADLPNGGWVQLDNISFPIN